MVRALVMASALLVAIGAFGPDGPQDRPFRASVHMVAVYPLVSGTDGRLVTDLGVDDFTVLDNGQPAQISIFSSDTQPITAALLLDMSSSMDDHLKRVREAALGFVSAIGPADRVRVGTFGSEIALSPWLTGDKALLSRVLREELWPGGSTPLWNALDAGMRSLAPEPGRRTLVVVTDGVDTSTATQTAVIDRAISGLFMVYAIGLEGKGLSGKLVNLIGQTGGGHFNLQRADDLGAAFARLTEELKQQYLVGFTPAQLDGRTHQLEVRVRRPNLRVQAPKQFVAGIEK
jgi:Ca-activated chloride channel family protein